MTRDQASGDQEPAAGEAYERWASEFPEAAQALRELGPRPSPEDLRDWDRKYPEAVAGQVRLTLYSPEVIRKMRLHDAGWEPPAP